MCSDYLLRKAKHDQMISNDQLPNCQKKCSSRMILPSSLTSSERKQSYSAQSKFPCFLELPADSYVRDKLTSVHLHRLNLLQTTWLYLVFFTDRPKKPGSMWNPFCEQTIWLDWFWAQNQQLWTFQKPNIQPIELPTLGRVAGMAWTKTAGAGWSQPMLRVQFLVVDIRILGLKSYKTH